MYRLLVCIFFLLFILSLSYGKNNMTFKDRGQLVKEYAEALNKRIDKNEALRKAGRHNEIDFILDLRDPVIKKAASPPEDYYQRINSNLNTFNGTRSDQFTSFYVLLTSNFDNSEDGYLVKCLDELNKLNKLEDVTLNNVEDLKKLYGATLFEQDLNTPNNTLPHEDNFTREIIERSKLGDENHLGVLLHYRHIINTTGTKGDFIYYTSIAFDKRISELTRATVRSEIIDPLRSTLSGGEGTVSHTSLFKIIEKEISNAIEALSRDFKSDYALLLREAIELLDNSIVKNGQNPSKTFSPENKKYILNTGEDVLGLVKDQSSLNKKLAWYEYKTGKQYYVLFCDGIPNDHAEHDFLSDVVNGSKQFSKGQGVLLVIQYNPPVQVGNQYGSTVALPGIFSQETSFTSEVTGQLNKLNYSEAGYNDLILEVYAQLPKPLNLYTYYFRIDGAILYVSNSYESVSGHPDMERLNFYYDKENVEKYVNIIADARQKLSPLGQLLVNNTTLKSQLEEAKRNPQVELISHGLKEEYIPEFHKKYVDYYLASRYNAYFDKSFPFSSDVPSYAKSAEQEDPVLQVIDAASIALAPAGLDVIPDAIGGVYCTIKDDYFNAGIYYSSAATYLIPAGVVRQFANGAELAMEGGKVVIKGGKSVRELFKEAFAISDDLIDRLQTVPDIEYLVFDDVLIKKINALEGSKTIFLEQISDQPDFFKKLLARNSLVDSWKVLGDHPILRKKPENLENISKWLDKGIEPQKLTDGIAKSPSKQNLIDQLGTAKSKLHAQVLIKDYDNIPGVMKGRYVNNSSTLADKAIFPSYLAKEFDINQRTVETFAGHIEYLELKSGETIYRVSPAGKEGGAYWTLTKPEKLDDVVGGTAVQPEWNNFEFIHEYTVPDGITLKTWKGKAARQPVSETTTSNYHLPGGDEQLFINYISKQDPNFESLVKTIKAEW